jgi:putative ribosome biogenesis GTPase RsgA
MSHGDTAETPIENDQRHSVAGLVMQFGALIALRVSPANESVAPVIEAVRGRTVVLLGFSGAGKSTIANALLGESRVWEAATLLSRD